MSIPAERTEQWYLALEEQRHVQYCALRRAQYDKDMAAVFRTYLERTEPIYRERDIAIQEVHVVATFAYGKAYERRGNRIIRQCDKAISRISKALHSSESTMNKICQRDLAVENTWHKEALGMIKQGRFKLYEGLNLPWGPETETGSLDTIQSDPELGAEDERPPYDFDFEELVLKELVRYKTLVNDLLESFNAAKQQQESDALRVLQAFKIEWARMTSAVRNQPDLSNKARIKQLTKLERLYLDHSRQVADTLQASTKELLAGYRGTLIKEQHRHRYGMTLLRTEGVDAYEGLSLPWPATSNSVADTPQIGLELDV